MNPTVAQPTMPRPAMDIARPMSRPQRLQPVAPARPVAAPAVSQPPVAVAPVVPTPVVAAPVPAVNPAASATLTTSIVNNIPLHAPTAVQPAANEDAELDMIMQDVGHELKQADRKHTKKHLSLFGHKQKKSPAVAVPQKTEVIDIKPVAQPVPQPQPIASPAQPAPVVGTKLAKDPKTSSAPVGVIFFTILVTGALIAAAFYSYK